MTTACCHTAPMALPSRSPQRWLASLHDAWTAWRESSRRWAEVQALEQLSESTRRDLGLAERAPVSSRSSLWEYERGLW